jgi:hypothetical protein
MGAPTSVREAVAEWEAIATSVGIRKDQPEGALFATMQKTALSLNEAIEVLSELLHSLTSPQGSPALQRAIAPAAKSAFASVAGALISSIKWYALAAVTALAVVCFSSGWLARGWAASPLETRIANDCLRAAKPAQGGGVACAIWVTRP